MIEKEKSPLSNFNFDYIPNSYKKRAEDKFMLKILATGALLEAGVVAVFYKSILAFMIKLLPAMLWLPSLIWTIN